MQVGRHPQLLYVESVWSIEGTCLILIWKALWLPAQTYMKWTVVRPWMRWNMERVHQAYRGRTWMMLLILEWQVAKFLMKSLVHIQKMIALWLVILWHFLRLAHQVWREVGNDLPSLQQQLMWTTSLGQICLVIFEGTLTTIMEYCTDLNNF